MQPLHALYMLAAYVLSAMFGVLRSTGKWRLWLGNTLVHWCKSKQQYARHVSNNSSRVLSREYLRHSKGSSGVCCACREKEALAHQHARALEQAKSAVHEERSAWRAAVTEKIKRQAQEREDQLRQQLVKERDAEIDLVIQRLEAEQQAALQAAKQKVGFM